MTAAQLADGFMKLSLLGHLEFQMIMGGMMCLGRLEWEPNGVVTGAPNESLHLIRSQLRRLLSVLGVHSKTIQRLMAAVIGQMREYREAKATIRLMTSGGQPRFRVEMRKTRRKCP